VLGTAHLNRSWVAPVYYVFHKASFYFFSKPDSRHIEDALANNEASASIHPNVSSWQEIKGLQMSGIVKNARPGIKTLEALKKYLQKYPFTKEFFKVEQELDLKAFSERFKVKLYYFNPTLVYYVDNSIRFGFRQEIIL